MEVFDRAKSIFQKVIKSYHNGIPGVRVFDSGVPGPTVGVVAMLHGNEPCGLAVYELLEENPGILDRGKVIFCIGNIFAAERYFSTDDRNERLQFRSLLVNMNRIPETSLQHGNSVEPEVIRFKQLIGILKNCDLVVDYHSTSLPKDRMLIPNQVWDIIDYLPVGAIIRDMIPKFREKTLIGVLGELNTKASVIECGLHEEESTWRFASYFFITVLEKFSMSNKDFQGSKNNDLLTRPKDVRTFHVLHSIWFPNDNFRMVKNFENFEPIKAGQELAFDPTSGEKIVSPIDGVILFPFPIGHEKGTTEEACFIGREIYKCCCVF